MAANKQIRNSTAEFLIFASQNVTDSIEVRFEEETLWLTQPLMAELFGCTPENVILHLKNIYEDGELRQEATAKEFLAVGIEGGRQVKRMRKYFNLDAIIAVGYRVNSKRATPFRQWAAAVLRDYTLRGYVIDRKRMENRKFLGKDYFEHLLAEIREIRLSERRFFQKITAESEFEKYRVIQDRLFKSDFDRQMDLLESQNEENGRESEEWQNLGAVKKC